MPEYLQLPPVAQGVLAITGFVLAVIRLLTASRPFWDHPLLPAWVQKGLPALLVGLGGIPMAIEHARNWLDVVVACVVAAAAWYTASRGDKRPPEDKGGGPRVERVNSDPKLRPEDVIDDTPPSLPGARMVGLLLGAAWLALVVACGASAQPKHPDATCSDEAYAALTAECAAKAARCVAEGGAEEACGSICDAAADDWGQRCQ